MNDADQSLATAPRGMGDPSAGLLLLSPLHALDTFVQELQRCDQHGRQLRLLLKVVSESVQADAVFVQSAGSDSVFETAGRVTLEPDWCRALLRELLDEAADGRSHLVRSRMSANPNRPEPNPESVALVQVSKSRHTWLVALSFTSGRRFRLLDIKLMVLARRLLVSHARQLQSAEKLRETLLGLIHCLTAAIDAKDPYTCGHSERVARIAVRIGQQMKLSEGLLSDIYLAGLLHDIGKIGVEDRILRKPSPLTEEETQAVQQHPVIGDRIIASVRPLAHLRPGVRNHHERLDGQGYPDRLAGLEIPLLARLLAVADSCDAMMSARPYRPPMPTQQIETVLRNGSGSQWDPQIIDHFLVCRQDIYGIRQQGIGDSLHLAVNHAVAVGQGPGAGPSVCIRSERASPPFEPVA